MKLFMMYALLNLWTCLYIKHYYYVTCVYYGLYCYLCVMQSPSNKIYVKEWWLQKKHLVCWKFKQQHQWQNEISCISSSKLKKQNIDVLCLLCCRYVTIKFRSKKYMHETFIIQCYSLNQTARAKFIKRHDVWW